MATRIRKTDTWVQPVADAHNALKVQIGAGSKYHLDASELIPVAGAPSGLPACLVTLKNLIACYIFHAADLLALKVADAGSLPLPTDPVDLTTANTAANLLKTFHGTHIASTTIHYNADSTNTITSANATDQGSLETLLAELLTDFTAHIANAPSAPSLRTVAA